MSILIKDTTIAERKEIVRKALDFGDGECEGVDMEDMYDDYILGIRELAEINAEFSRNHAGVVVANRQEKASGCGMGR